MGFFCVENVCSGVVLERLFGEFGGELIILGDPIAGGEFVVLGDPTVGGE
jgi:hypothetical protein